MLGSPVSQAGADLQAVERSPDHLGHGDQARIRASSLSTMLRAALTPGMMFSQDFTKGGSETEKVGRKKEGGRHF